MLYVNIKTLTNNADGTLDVVLECDGTQVQCEGTAWVDTDYENDELMMVFEEWYSLAQEGETGYTIV